MEIVYKPRVEDLTIRIGDKTIIAPISIDLSTTAEISDMCNKAKDDAESSDAAMQAAIDAQDGQALIKAATEATSIAAPVVRKMLGEKAYKELCEAFGYTEEDAPINAYRVFMEIIRSVGSIYRQQTAISREKAAHYLQETEDARAAANGTV